MNLSNLITTVEHSLASGVQKVHDLGMWILHVGKPALEKIEASAATIEAITGLISPAAASIERVGAALLGRALKAIDSIEAAEAAGGVNITLDAAMIADLKAILPIIKEHAPPVVAVVPTPTPAIP